MIKQPTRVGRYLLYGLIDSGERCLFYVGKTHKRRELRLREHLEAAEMLSSAPVHARIREILSVGNEVEIFVLRKIEPDACWQTAEREEIERWRNYQDHLPLTYLPQTPKSCEMQINQVELVNVRDGG